MKKIIIILLLLLPFMSIAQENKKELIASETIFFNPNSYSPDAVEMVRLNLFLKKTRGKSTSEIIIYSGTDSIGDTEENIRLSQKRSNAVADYLQQNGFDSKIIKKNNFGESNPIADNNTESGRRNNRYSRIEFYENRLDLGNFIRIRGFLKDDETNLPLADSMVLVFHKENPDTVYTDKKGVFEVVVPDSTKSVDLFIKDYFFVTIKTDKEKSRDLKVDLPAKKAKIDNRANFDDINFHGGNAVMLPGSYKICDKIVRFLKFNPNRVIEIAGHVNVPNSIKVSTDSWDYNLSVQRAIRVSKYLKERGIDNDRIVPKGYGNWEMLYPNAISEEEQKKNRRVEIRIIK